MQCPCKECENLTKTKYICSKKCEKLKEFQSFLDKRKTNYNLKYYNNEEHTVCFSRKNMYFL